MSNLHFYDKKERPWPNQRLDRSAIVGHTTTTTTRLWVRTKNEGRHFIVFAAENTDGLPENGFKGLEGEPVVSDGGDKFKYKKDGADKTLDLRFAEEINSSFDTDNTSVVNVTGLDADSRYHYAVIMMGRDGAPNEWELGHESSLSFKTLPDAPVAFTFGLYSCHMPYPSDFGEAGFEARMWNVFKEELAYSDARFVIGGGDQVYADGNDKMSVWNWLERVRDDNPTDDDMVSWYRDIYRGYWGIGALQSIHRSFPNYMIWDDHEIMDGWGSYTPDELSQKMDTLSRKEDEEENNRLAHRMKNAATRVYTEYQHSHNPPTDEGVFDYPFTACGCDFYVLDMRGYRTFKKGGKHNILGKPQYERFGAWAQALDDSPNKGPIFVVSPVPTVHLKDFVSNILDWLAIFGARDDVRDHWEHNAHTQEYIDFMNACFDASQRTKRPLVFLSGDVHVGTIFKLGKKTHPDAKVYQVTSSAITYAALNDRSRAALGKAVKSEGEIKKNKMKTGIIYRRYFTYVQNNIAIFDVRMNGEGTTNLYVNIVGMDNDTGVTESKRVDLLKLV